MSHSYSVIYSFNIPLFVQNVTCMTVHILAVHYIVCVAICVCCELLLIAYILYICCVMMILTKFRHRIDKAYFFCILACIYILVTALQLNKCLLFNLCLCCFKSFIHEIAIAVGVTNSTIGNNDPSTGYCSITGQLDVIDCHTISYRICLWCVGDTRYTVNDISSVHS